MGDIIGLISGKGGVGKTTITACLGAALSEQGYRVLLCDGDFGLRDLDIILGKEDEVCFDAYNALEDKSMADDVVMKVQDNLYFCQLVKVCAGKIWVAKNIETCKPLS